MKEVKLGAEIDPVLIESLEGLLEKAKRGEITDYFFAGFVLGGELINSFKATNNTMALLGELRCLEHDLIDCCVDKRLHPAGREY